MQIVFAGEPYPQMVKKMLYLVDLTSQQGGADSSWWAEAVELLERLSYDGVVFVPEERGGGLTPALLDDEARVRWIHGALMRCDVSVFVLSATAQALPDGVMGVELGRLMGRGHIIFVIPSEVRETSDLQYYIKELLIPCHATLLEALREAVNSIGGGAQRQGGEAAVPLEIWETESFQRWLAAQKKAGNRLDDARIEAITRVRARGNLVFLWVMYVKVWIQGEGRHKENEWVIGRPDISSVMLYLPHPGEPMETEIVLVREYRSPATNSQAIIYELPGGSSFRPGVHPRTLALQEVREETNITLHDGDKLRGHMVRQLAGTLSAHKCHLFSWELTPEEMSDIEEMAGRTFGEREDTEQTTLLVKSLRELLNSDLVDFATLGMIMQALADNGMIK
jgi:8-oxo-dGTP pyrophosphatase MutT (NUDIX family)